MNREELIPENWKQINEEQLLRIPSFEDFVKQQKDKNDDEEEDKKTKKVKKDGAVDTGKLTKDANISSEAPQKDPEVEDKKDKNKEVKDKKDKEKKSKEDDEDEEEEEDEDIF